MVTHVMGCGESVSESGARDGSCFAANPRGSAMYPSTRAVGLRCYAAIDAGMYAAVQELPAVARVCVICITEGQETGKRVCVVARAQFVLDCDGSCAVQGKESIHRIPFP